MPVRTLRQPSAERDGDGSGRAELWLMCLGPLALVFVGTLVTGLTYRPLRTGKLVFGTKFWSGIAAVPLGMTLLVCGWFWLRHRRGRRENRRSAESASPDRRRLWWTMWACVAGILAGLVARTYLGRVDVTAFCNGSAPLIAGLLVGIVFEGSEATRRRAQKSGDPPDEAVYVQRQLGVVYILAGALCTALGTIPSQGSFYQAYFVAICGSLGASCYVVLDIVMSSADERWAQPRAPGMDDGPG